MKWTIVAAGLLFAVPAMADDACEALQFQQALALMPQIDCSPPVKPHHVNADPKSPAATADVAALEARVQLLERRLNFIEAQLLARR